MKEAYCSYEISKLLKKKGFDWDCTSHFDGEHKERPNTLLNCNLAKHWVSRPTHQMACAWLREIHNIDIEIRRSPNTMMYKCLVYKDTLVKCITDAIMETYEDAAEAALKYVLENLI